MNGFRCMALIFVINATFVVPGSCQETDSCPIGGVWKYQLLIKGEWQTHGGVTVTCTDEGLQMSVGGVKSTAYKKRPYGQKLNVDQLINAKLIGNTWTFDLKTRQRYGIRHFHLQQTEEGLFEGKTTSRDRRLIHYPVRMVRDTESDPGKPGSVVVLIHGVASSADAFEHFIKKIGNKDLNKSWIVQFEWGREWFFKASNGVGRRCGYVKGLSHEGWIAVAKLKDVIAQIREQLGDEIPISIVSHSQGSIITLAALQEGMSVDNWMLMGSPLSQGNVQSGNKETRFGVAAKNVSGKVISFWSDADDTASYPPGTGIGSGGLPTTIHGISGRFANHQLGNVYDQFIENVDHYVDEKDEPSDEGWWEMDWLAQNNRQWKGALTSQEVIELLRGKPIGGIPSVTDAFQSIMDFASEGTRDNAWSKIYGDSRYNTFEHTFTLTEGMMNGVYFDEKDVAKFDIEAIQGDCEFQIVSATGNKYNQKSDLFPLNEGEENTKENDADIYVVDGFRDATIFLKITGKSKSITKVRARLTGINE